MILALSATALAFYEDQVFGNGGSNNDDNDDSADSGGCFCTSLGGGSMALLAFPVWGTRRRRRKT